MNNFYNDSAQKYIMHKESVEHSWKTWLTWQVKVNDVQNQAM